MLMLYLIPCSTLFLEGGFITSPLPESNLGSGMDPNKTVLSEGFWPTHIQNLNYLHLDNILITEWCSMMERKCQTLSNYFLTFLSWFIYLLNFLFILHYVIFVEFFLNYIVLYLHKFFSCFEKNFLLRGRLHIMKCSFQVFVKKSYHCCRFQKWLSWALVRFFCNKTFIALVSFFLSKNKIAIY